MQFVSTIFLAEAWMDWGWSEDCWCYQAEVVREIGCRRRVHVLTQRVNGLGWAGGDAIQMSLVDIKLKGWCQLSQTQIQFTLKRPFGGTIRPFVGPRALGAPVLFCEILTWLMTGHCLADVCDMKNVPHAQYLIDYNVLDRYLEFCTKLYWLNVWSQIVQIVKCLGDEDDCLYYIKSSLVPLLAGLCAQIYLDSRSRCCSHLLVSFFAKGKTCLKKIKKQLLVVQISPLRSAASGHAKLPPIHLPTTSFLSHQPRDSKFFFSLSLMIPLFFQKTWADRLWSQIACIITGLTRRYSRIISMSSLVCWHRAVKYCSRRKNVDDYCAVLQCVAVRCKCWWLLCCIWELYQYM